MSGALRLAQAVREAAARTEEALNQAYADGDLSNGEVAARQRDERAVRDRYAALPLDERMPLLETDVPLALLPVRIETRFTGVPNDPALKIRVFPDQIHVDDHEPFLTEAEWQAGMAYWRHAAEGRDAEEWLGAIVGPNRMAHVRAQTRFDPASGEQPPKPTLRPENWARPAMARLLPESWRIVCDYAGTRETYDFPRAVAPDLPLAPSSRDEAGVLEGAALDALWTGGGLAGGETGIAWMLDFTLALESGMAMELTAARAPDLIAHAMQGGALDLTVLGTRSWETAETAAQGLETHLAALNASGRVAAMAQGAPTQSDGEGSITRANLPQDPSQGTGHSRGQAATLSAALGVSSSALDAVDALGAVEDADARQMAVLAWRFGFGAFAREAMDVAEDEGWYNAADFIADNVRARGLLPLLRIGAQPYGVLPIASGGEGRISFAGGRATGFARRVHDLLPHVAPFWTRHTGQAPRIRFDQRQRPELLRDALIHDAHVAGLFGWLGTVTTPGSQATPAARFLDGLGLTDAARTLAARQIFLSSAAIDIAAPAPFVRYDTPPIRSFAPDWEPIELFDDGSILFETLENAVGSDRYPLQLWREYPRILAISAGQAAEIMRDPSVLDDIAGDPPDPIFHTLLRQSLFDLFQRVAAALLEADGQHVPPVAGIDPHTKRRIFPRVAKCIEGPLQGEADRMRLPLRAEDTRRLPPRLAREVEAVCEAALDCARRMRTADGTEAVSLLLREQLSLLTYRLDPWYGALTRMDMQALRHARPRGLHIGAWSRVEGLRIGASGDIGRDYLLAPSLAQATTAAILRSGNQARRAETRSQEAYAIDLSSAKLAAAREILSGINAGRPLASVLGFRLERALRGGPNLTHTAGSSASAPPHPGAIGDLIDRLRALAPAVAGRIKDDNRQPQAADQAIPASTDIADGLELLRRLDADRAALNRAIGPNADIALRALDALQKDVDAVGDLLLAEGVHQISTGNAARAGASVDALSRGESAPERFDAVDTQRPGIGVEIRLVAAAPAAAMPATPDLASAPDTSTLRRALAVGAGPLATLAGRWMEGLDTAELPVLVRDAGTVLWSGAVSPAELGLSTVDLLLPEPHLRRLIGVLATRHARTQAFAATSELLPDHKVELAWEGSDLAASLIAIAPLRSGIASSRALQADDLVEGEGEGGVTMDEGEFIARARNVVTLFAYAIARLRDAAGPPPDAAELAALGTPAILPPPDLDSVLAPVSPTMSLTRPSALDVDDPRLLSALYEARGGLGDTALAAMQDALITLAMMGIESAAVELTDPATQLSSAMRALRIRWLAASDAATPEEQLQAILGEALPFPPVLSASADAPIRGAAVSAESDALVEWLDGAADIRRNCAAFRDGLAACELFGSTTRLILSAAQLPSEHSNAAIRSPWAGINRPDMSGARVAFAVQGNLADGPLGGLMIDSWSETVPDPQGTTGLALQARTPQARAPQSILLALPPGDGAQWTAEHLIGVVDRTVELMALRGIRPFDLSDPDLPLPLLHIGTRQES